MTTYDLWLDENLEDWYSEDTDDFDEEPEWDGPYPDDYDNYDGWDDMQ